MSGTVPPPLKKTSQSRTGKKSKPEAKTKANEPAPSEEELHHRKTVLQTLGVFGVSFVLHVLALIVMGFIVLANNNQLPLLGILSSLPEPVKQKIDLTEVEIKKPEEVEEKDKPAEIVKKVLAKTQDRFEIDVNDLKPSANLFPDPKAVAPAAAAPNRGYFGGRSKAGRAALLAKYGGTKESEAAVREGLQWLVRHQNSDGSWSFDHRVYKCDCKNPGTMARSKMGATAMALLCFLGAGHTYSQGDFKPYVESGLLYLLKHGNLRNGLPTKSAGDFRGDFEANSGMYIQGLVSIVLCEALAMNEAMRQQEYLAGIHVKGQPRKRSTVKSRREDKRRRLDILRRKKVSEQLYAAAKTAIYFVVSAQNPSNGGWRYQPRVSADTSVTGWQVMALASAHSANIMVDGKTIHGVMSYLDSVGTSRGDRYGYVSNKPTPTMTAVGLLCRMYLGWTRGNPGIRYGVQYLSQVGPSRTNMYYNYYATQVMHQYGGELWKEWNKVMRDQLVTTQRKKGHAKGSWDLTDPHGAAGGRLYQTCLSIMTLEVYYRHMPLYEQRDLENVGQKDSFAKTVHKSKPRKGGKARGKSTKKRGKQPAGKAKRTRKTAKPKSKS